MKAFSDSVLDGRKTRGFVTRENRVLSTRHVFDILSCDLCFVLRGTGPGRNSERLLSSSFDTSSRSIPDALHVKNLNYLEEKKL